MWCCGHSPHGKGAGTLPRKKPENAVPALWLFEARHANNAHQPPLATQRRQEKARTKRYQEIPSDSEHDKTFRLASRKRARTRSECVMWTGLCACGFIVLCGETAS